MRAIIDIGTNSVRLLIAEKEDKGDWKILRKEVNSSRLGEGMTETASISRVPRERTMRAVEEFVLKAKAEGVKDIRAFGTAIMREAKKGQVFADEITSYTGIPVRILSGKEEAYYSYIGAVGVSNVVSSVIDIGGGSTEICMGYGRDIGLRKSFPLGCVRCSRQFDTTTARGRGELKKYCFEIFAEGDIFMEVKPVKRWIGVGGTITSLAAVMQEMDVYDSSKIQDYVLKQEDVSRLSLWLTGMSYDERSSVKGLQPERADIIVAGTVILDSVMEYFALPEILVSDRDLTEGLLDEGISGMDA